MENYQNQQSQQTPNYAPVLPQNPGKGLNIASLVLGICGLVIPYVGLVCAIVGLVLGIIGRGKSKEVGAPTGMGTAGIVLSVIGIACAIIIILLIVGVMASLA